MGFIDAHAHIWTDDTGHYPLGSGWKKEDMHPGRFTPADLLEHMKTAGVDRVNLIQMSYYGPAPGAKVDTSRDNRSTGIVNGFDNSYMLDMMALHKDVFVGTAVIDPHASGVAELMGDMAKKRVRAFRIYPKLSKEPIERWLEAPGYATMFASAARHNQAISCLINPDALPEIDRMCRKYPTTPVIIDHIARIGVDGTIREKDVASLCALAQHPRVLVKIGAFYALGKKAPPYTDLAPTIEKVLKAYGVRRCMWESDCPFQIVDHEYLNSFNLVRKRLPFLSEDDKDWLLRRTAEEFFFKG